jgi:lipoprotein-anchoring transpeptidase ErfK/SrfK
MTARASERGRALRGAGCALLAALFSVGLNESRAQATPAPTHPPLPAFSSEQVLARSTESVGPRSAGAATLRAQIRLDRARFSPGEIDGRYGSNFRNALRAYQKAMSLPVTGTVDAATWQALDREADPVLARYRVTDADIAGPFQPVPDDMMEKARLPALGYVSVAEALGERFHASPELLAHLNPGRDLGKVGEEILVPNVHPPGKVDGVETVVVDKSDSTVSLRDAQDRVLAQFPATTGSRHDPLPIGRWKINGVGRNPEFKYNPKLFWDAEPGHEKTVIRPGPNNPVGVVWVDLSKPHYGIHGTPEPAKIGKTQSHGCIRLTNWDAATVGDSVSPGMPARLQR